MAYTGSGLGLNVRFTVEGNELDGIANELPYAMRDGLRTTAEEAISEVYWQTPMSNKPYPGGHMRDRKNIQIQFHGTQGYMTVSWKARNNRGQHYAPYQEHIQYSEYTTPGTGPGFMAEAEEYIMKHGAARVIQASQVIMDKRSVR